MGWIRRRVRVSGAVRIVGAALVIPWIAAGLVPLLNGPLWLTLALTAIALCGAIIAVGLVLHSESAEQREGQLKLFLPLHVDPPEHAGIPSLSRLLSWQGNLVRFRGRGSELDELHSWFNSEPGYEVGLLTGPHGVGKTRLAAHFCEQVRRQGGIAGLLREGARIDALDSLPGHRARLIVVDDADGRPDVADLLAELSRSRRTRRTRVLLVARRAGVWLQRDVPLQVFGDLSVSESFSQTTLWELGAVDVSNDGRQEAFRNAADAFATALALPNVISAPYLGGPLFESILFIHLAALHAVCAPAPETLPAPPEATLLNFLLERESAYWLRTARTQAIGLDLDVLQGVVAVAALVGTAATSELAPFLRLLPEVRDDQELGRLTRWLLDLYAPAAGISSPEPYMSPVTPDVLADALISRVTGLQPDLPLRVAEMASEDQLFRILAALTRASAADESIRRHLKHVLANQLHRAWPVAIRVATQVGEPIGSLLNEVLTESPAPSLAYDIEPHLRLDVPALTDFAETCMEQALSHAWQLPRTKERDATIAGILVQLAYHRSHLGQQSDLRPAYKAIQQAIAILRRLSRTRFNRYGARLAGAMALLAVIYRDDGDLSAALAMAEEAVSLARQHAEQTGKPDTERLGAALDVLAGLLADAGRNAAAIDVEREAVALARVEVAGRGDTYDRRNLGGRLTNLAVRLHEAGQHNEAVRLSAEAVAVFRDALSSGGGIVYLGVALHNLAVHDGPAIEERLAASQEAAAILRQQYTFRPGEFIGVRFAAALHNTVKLLSLLGRSGEALECCREELDVCEGLVNRSEAHGFWPDRALVKALTQYSGLASDLGRPDESQRAANEALELLRELVKGHKASEPDLADTLLSASAVLGGVARVTVGEEAVTLFRKLVQDQPTRTGKLAGALENLARGYREAGRPGDAMAAAEEAASMRRQNDGSASGRIELANSLMLCASLRGDVGDYQAALESSEESLDLFRAEAAAPFADTSALAEALTSTCSYLIQLGRPDEGVTLADEAIDVVDRAMRRSETRFRGAMAHALGVKALALMEMRRHWDARSAAAEAVRICRKGTARGDTTVLLLNEALRILGAVQLQAGQVHAGVSACQEAIAILRPLAGAAPGRYGVPLAQTHHNLSIGLRRIGKNDEALEASDVAMELFEDMRAQYPEIARVGLVTELKNRAVILRKMGLPHEARRAERDAIAAGQRLTRAKRRRRS